MNIVHTPPEMYNVQCHECNRVWSPMKGSGLWIAAKRHESIEALYVGPATCGCVQPIRQPGAPFRVCGYDSMCVEYDIPCKTFMQAVKCFKKFYDYGDIVIIIGISHAVEQKIRYFRC